MLEEECVLHIYRKIRVYRYTCICNRGCNKETERLTGVLMAIREVVIITKYHIGTLTARNLKIKEIPSLTAMLMLVSRL